MLGEWILLGSERITRESVVTGFKNCCLSNAPNGTENDFL
jgi:hypothetical protein